MTTLLRPQTKCTVCERVAKLQAYRNCSHRMIRSLLFTQILAGNIILRRHFMRANFALVSVPGVFHARHHLGLERVSLLEQLVHTLRIRTLDCSPGCAPSLSSANATVPTLWLFP